MNAEERLRNHLRSAGPPPTATESDWSLFAQVAHRNRHRRRITAMIAAVLVIGVAAGTWAVDRIGDQSMPPSGGPVEPVLLTQDIPQECPEAEPYEPASDLGAVAFVRHGDVFRADLQGGEVKLVEGRAGIVPDVEWSADGRWISLANGVVVRARGEAICRPLGRMGLEPTWGPDNTLIGIDENRSLVVGGPGREPQIITKLPLRIRSFALDPTGNRVAVQADRVDESRESYREAQIQVIDIASRETTTILDIAGAPDLVSPQIAGWSPDGQWILYWRATGIPRINMEGIPLEAVRVTGGAPVRITEKIVASRQALDWCGQTLVFEAPDERLIPDGKRIVVARPPQWQTELLTNLASDIWSSPLCSPDGRAFAGIKFSVYPEKNDTPRIGIFPLEDAVGMDSQMQRAEYRNPSEWSADGRWVMVEMKWLDSGQITLRLEGLRRGTSGSFPLRVNLVELGEEAEMFGTRAYDWYQP